MANNSKQILLKKLQSKVNQAPNGVAFARSTNTASVGKKRELLGRLNTIAENQQVLKQQLSTLAEQDRWQEKTTEKTSTNAKMAVSDGSYGVSRSFEKETPWYKSGAFEDGYDFGDVIKFILGVDDKKTRSRFTGIVEDKDDAEQMLSTMTSTEIEEKKNSATTGEDRRYYDDLAIQKQVAEIEEKLSKVTLENGTTLLEEVHAVAEMEDGKEKKERKKALEEKMLKAGVNADMWYSMLTGDKNITWTTAKKFAGEAINKGLGSFNTSLTGFLDLTVGAILKGVGWEDNPISKLDDYYEDQYAAASHNLELAKARMGAGGWADGVGNLTEGTVAALPQAIMAIATMGGSTAPSLTTTAAQATGSILQNAGITIKQMLKNPQFWTSFVTTYANDYEDAKKNGADDLTAGFSATITSMMNAGVEVGGGIQTLPGNLKGKGNKAITEWVKSTLEEGGEEVVQGIISDSIAKGLYDSDREIANPGEMLQEFGMGAAVGGILGGGQVGVASAINTGVNAVEKHQAKQLNENEQKVVNKVYEDELVQKEKNGKLTAREKSKLYDKVLEDLEQGRISTDTIESVLGGDTYKGYQKALAQESKLKKEIEELESLPDNAITVKQRERLTEARKELEGLDTKTAKSKLFTEVDKLTANDTKLRESYNERTRRGQAFTADLTKYDAKQQETVKRAIESGILNNTNRTHEFVDLIAKISANKGVSFNFADNAKLKESGFAIDGKQVNGFVTADGVTININSAKALNSVVGHEITHVLEGTELYNELQSAITEYAKSKGDYQGRYDALTELYKDIEGADIDAELTADLVGDYLFTDADFVQRLSTEHRGVFQKLFDEIKHLCKLTTAGTKEARELERVKRTFENVFRENVRAKDLKNTKYSLENGNKRKYNKRSRYSETETQFLSWENGSSPVGEVKKFVRFGKTQYYEKTENGCVELSRAQYNERNGADVEKNYRRAEREIGETYDYDASTQRGIVGHPNSNGDPSRAASVFGQTFRKELSDDATGGISSTLRYDSGTDIKQPEYNEEASDNSGASSLITFSNDYATIRNYMKEDPGQVASSETKNNADERKAQQFAIIQETNPMWDDYHTGIRSVEDIRTWEEVLELDDEREGQFVWGDFSREDAKNALKNNSVTVYSSHPISNGIFVSTSYIQAWEYAGGNKSAKVYSKEVPLDEVAWINGDEGQYAKVEEGQSVDYSLSENEQTTAPAGEYRITGEDIALAPTKEDIARMEQEKERIATAQTAPRNDVGVQGAPDNDVEELGAPTREDILQMEMERELYGDWRMTDPLDRKVEKLYRLMLLERISEEEYNAQLVKADRQYQQRGSRIEEALERIQQAYSKYQEKPAAEDSTVVNTDPAQHTPEEQAIIEEYQAAVDEALVNYVEKVKANPGAKNGRYTLKYVSNRAAADIKKLTGVDVTGNKTQIEGRIVEHILKRHGENGKADHSMRDVNDIARIQYVLDNYDNITVGEKTNGYRNLDADGKLVPAQTVILSKKVNGTYYVVEAVPESKAKALFITSAYMAKNGQKKSAAAPLVGDAEAYRVTSETKSKSTAAQAGTTVPTNTVPQNFDDVKSDEEIIKTVKERLSAKITNSTEELSQIKLLRDWVKASYDHKIANLQAEYDGKKNKDTKTAVRMKNRLESLKRISADLDADLQKRISDIEVRIAKASEKMAEPSVKDILEVRYERIDRQLQEDKAALEAEFQKKKADSQAAVADKSEYIRKKAKDLYWELNNLRKGVRASTELGYLKDSGYSWEEIKTALVNVSNSPDKRVNIHSAVESTARQMLNDSYESAVYDADELDSDYQRAVAELEEEAKRQKEAVRKDYERTTQKELHKGIMDRIRDALAKAGFDLNTVLKNAKNLSTFATVDNTPQRVNEKTFGYKAGQIINDLTVNKAALNESDGIQWLNGQIDKIRKLSERYGIKPGSKESRAAQIYGEGFWVNEAGEYIQYGDAELAADFPDTEKQAKIKALAKSQEVRQMYDETLDAINAARVRNGYPPIPRRENYFLHYRAQDDTFSKIGVPFNPNDVRAKDLPTDLNGVTADLKPGKPFFASEMHRTGDKTTHDLIGGLERYMNSAKNQIYHIDDIQTLRAMRNYIADMFGQANGLADLDSLSPEEQEQRIKEVFDNHLSTYAKFLNEEANIFAGKTALIDRGVEGVLGRRAIQFLHTLNGQVGKNMVGYNISSAGTNVLPVVQATAMLPKADMMKAFAQTISNKFRSDGFVESDPALIRRRGADQFAKTPWQRMTDPGYALMGAVDNLSSELIVRAKYNELTRKGMDSQQAHIRAGEWASRLMGDRSLGQMPQLYNSKTLGLITKFQLEVRNQLDAMGYDVIQEAKAEEGTSNAKKAAKVASTIAQLAIFQHLFGQAYEAVAGYNPAFDIVENLIKLFGFDDEEESEDTFGDNVEQAFFGLLDDLPYTSILTGGRIPIASALPVEEFITGKDSYGNEKDRIETLAEALPYYIIPGGYGQLKKTAQGVKMFDEDLPVAGSYTESGNLRFPVEDDSIADWLQAALFGQYASKNAREYFDNGWAPLKEKQIEEFASLGIPIADYREIRKQLGKLETTADKVDYIGSLDLTVEQKNILVNNVVDRKEPVDMTDYDMYEDFDEFDFYIKNQEKYQFLKDNGIAYKTYKASEESREAYNWAFQNPEKYQVSRAVTEDTVTYKSYTKALSEIKADKDSKGNAVAGSRKKKVVQYLNGLDAVYGAKLVLYKMEYPSDDTYNGKIVQYVSGIEGFTFEQKTTVLQELGFTVTADGKVSWN